MRWKGEGEGRDGRGGQVRGEKEREWDDQQVWALFDFERHAAEQSMQDGEPRVDSAVVGGRELVDIVLLEIALSADEHPLA